MGSEFLTEHLPYACRKTFWKISRRDDRRIRYHAFKLGPDERVVFDASFPAQRAAKPSQGIQNPVDTLCCQFIIMVTLMDEDTEFMDFQGNDVCPCPRTI